MGTQEHRRQKKLAKRQRREKDVRKKTIINRNLSTREWILRNARGPWVECLINNDEGMCSFHAVRQSKNGGRVLAIGLVDAYCLGLKDAAFRSDANWDIYKEKTEHLRDDPDNFVTPSYVLKLMQGAVEFARSWGFPPHADYELLLAFFGDVDPNECKEEFEFGKEGKPFYIAGPFDPYDKQRLIVETIREHLGPDDLEGPHFLLRPTGDRGVLAYSKNAFPNLERNLTEVNPDDDEFGNMDEDEEDYDHGDRNKPAGESW